MPACAALGFGIIVFNFFFLFYLSTIGETFKRCGHGCRTNSRLVAALHAATAGGDGGDGGTSAHDQIICLTEMNVSYVANGPSYRTAALRSS